MTCASLPSSCSSLSEAAQADLCHPVFPCRMAFFYSRHQSDAAGVRLRSHSGAAVKGSFHAAQG